MSVCVLYRKSLMTDEEENAIHEYFPSSVTQRSKVHCGELVIGRYSVLPYYKELETDLMFGGAQLINSYRDHLFVADIREWYSYLHRYTPKTWFELSDVPKDGGPFVLKGATNSRKNNWSTHMFAKNFQEATQIYTALTQDGFLCDQPIYIRQYVPLVNYGHAIGGVPISHEFRFFVLDGQVLTGAYYWANHVESLEKIPDVEEVPKEFMAKVLRAIGDSIRFYVVDVAKTQSGEWIVIELNDGQMSGLSCNDPNVLYRELRQRFPALKSED